MEKLIRNAFSERLHIHQIYYDAASHAMLDPGFIPLDNSTDTRPDWYEFWAIRKYLLTHELQEDHWYGFLSPKFAAKTGLTSQHVFRFLEQIDSQGADVGLVLCHFNEIALYWNCFEQGDRIHPGLTEATEQWLSESGINPNIRNIVNHTNNFTYCNYVIAKEKYWKDWLKLADALLTTTDKKTSILTTRLNAQTRHAGKDRSVPMKVFVQERFPSIILIDSKFKIVTTENSKNHNLPLSQNLKQHYIHACLATLNWLKIWYDTTKDTQYSDEFFRLREIFLKLLK